MSPSSHNVKRFLCTLNRVDRNARKAANVGPQIYPHKMTGTLFAGLFGLDLHDIAYDVAMEAEVLGLIVTQQSCIFLVQYCSCHDPKLASKVWDLAVRQGSAKHLGRLAFNMFKCYLDHGLIEEAKSLDESIKASKVGRYLQPGECTWEFASSVGTGAGCPLRSKCRCFENHRDIRHT